jgi:hypothetical protein
MERTVGGRPRRFCRQVREGPVLGRESHFGVSAELTFKDGDLVARGENLHVLVPIAHGQ